IGSQKINGVIRQHLPILLEKYHIIHICGKGNVDESINEQGYVQYEYVHDELNDIFAVTDFVISRAGSNAIFEFLALNIPMLLIPLSLNASRGDQIDNAKSFEQQGFAHVLLEEDVSDESLLQGIEHVTTNLKTYKAQLQTDDSEIARKKVIKTIEKMAK
ncbi:MAG TPA: glycosyltransferase, partial [Virgibacillus sp.]